MGKAKRKRKISPQIAIAIITAAGAVLAAAIGIVPFLTTPPGIANTETYTPSYTPTSGLSATSITPPYSNVLVDARHSPPTAFDKLSKISIDGVTFTKSSTDEFTLDNLTPYDAVIINFSGYEYSLAIEAGVQKFTPNEITAIHNYIEQGGGVFLIATSWVWTTYDKKPIDEFPLNLIAMNYGITFEGATANDCNIDGEEIVVTESLFNSQHPIAKDIRSIAISDQDTPSFLKIESPALKVASCAIATNPILAASEIGKGKIVAITHSSFVTKNLNDPNHDNYKLLKNILAWLVSE